MKKLFVPAALLAAVSLASVAYAATMDGSGTIKSINKTAHTITLNDGQVLNFQASVDVSKLKTGEKVSYVYESKDGKMWAQSFKPAK